MTLPIGSQEQTDCFGRCVDVISDPTSSGSALSAVFVVLCLVAGQAPFTTPLQNNQLTAPPHFCFCCTGVVTSYFYCFSWSFLLLLCQIESRSRANFLKPFKNSYLAILHGGGMAAGGAVSLPVAPDLLRDVEGVTANCRLGAGSLGQEEALDLRRGMPRRWRRSQRHLRLMPSLRAASEILPPLCLMAASMICSFHLSRLKSVSSRFWI